MQGVFPSLGSALPRSSIPFKEYPFWSNEYSPKVCVFNGIKLRGDEAEGKAEAKGATATEAAFKDQ